MKFNFEVSAMHRGRSLQHFSIRFDILPVLHRGRRSSDLEVKKLQRVLFGHVHHLQRSNVVHRRLNPSRSPDLPVSRNTSGTSHLQV
jgi:hypothetical protein